MTESHDRLEVKVLEGFNFEYLFGKPSVYVEITAGIDSRRTKIISDNKNPLWDNPPESPALPFIFNNVLMAGLDSVVIYVRHRDSVTGRDIDLGMIVLPLDTYYNSPMVVMAAWFQLRAAPSMSKDEADNDHGSLRLCITYFNQRDPNVTMPPASSIKENPPNLLEVMIIRAEHVRGSRKYINALATVQVGDLRKETKIIKKAVDPFWEEKLTLPVSNGEQLIDVNIKHSGVLSRVTVGRVRISMVEVAAAGTVGINNTKYSLLNENLEFDGVERGSIFLGLKWIYDEATANMKKEKSRSFFAEVRKYLAFLRPKKVKKEGEESDDEDEDDLTNMFGTAAVSNPTVKDTGKKARNEDDDDDDDDDNKYGQMKARHQYNH